MAKFTVLFVCTGNICRSPTAEGVLRHKLADAGLAGRVLVDSAGLGDWHIGDSPSKLAVEAAARRGYDLSDLRARRLVPQDYVRFDRLIAMDEGHHQHLSRHCPDDDLRRVRYLLEYADDADGLEIDDPYYGGEQEYEQSLTLIESAMDGLIAEIRGEIE